MNRFWWTVWIKVAVLAVVLILAYNFVTDKVDAILSPYRLETTEDTPLLERYDLENMIFDYANEFVQEMMVASDEERNVITETLG